MMELLDFTKVLGENWYVNLSKRHTRSHVLRQFRDARVKRGERLTVCGLRISGMVLGRSTGQPQCKRCLTMWREPIPFLYAPVTLPQENRPDSRHRPPG